MDAREQRAAELAVSPDWRERLARYHTTPTRCDCPDSAIRHTVCKHRRLAARIAVEGEPARFPANAQKRTNVLS